MIKISFKPAELEKWSFWWSEARLVFAAVALLLGGVPLIRALLPFGMFLQLEWLGLSIAWIVSGVASAYMLWRWYTGGQLLFGGKDTKDLVAFFVMIVSGFNLGLAGILGQNIGMNISSNRIVFIVVAIIYAVTVWHLSKRWKSFGQKMFSTPAVMSVPSNTDPAAPTA